MIIQLPIGLLGSNCYIVHNAGESAVVDPGFDDPEPLLEALNTHGLRVRYILNTHGHFDHTIGNARLQLPEAQLAIHPADRQLLLSGGGLAQFGLPEIASPEPALDLVEETPLTLGTLHIKVLHTPGHTPGSVCLYIPETGDVLTGDTLFAGAVGRTDLPGGDARQLTQSLRKLLQLPAETRVHPGHGDPTTLGVERQHNPWLQRLS